MNNTLKSMSHCHDRHSQSKQLESSEIVNKKNVTSGENSGVTMLERLSRLETLVTRLSQVSDTDSQEKSDVSDTCDIKSEDTCITQREVLVLLWFEHALEEGHIEPSQPNVVRLVGWPVRPFSFRSLWVDFSLWCAKNSNDVDEFNDMQLFKYLVSTIFLLRDDDYIVFGALEEARKRYKSLRRILEYFNLN